MLISCPSCAASYDVPDHLLSEAGQTVRCVRCLHEWLQHGPQPMEPVVQVAAVPALSVPALAVPAPAVPEPINPEPAVPPPVVLPELPRATPVSAQPMAPIRPDPVDVAAYNPIALAAAWVLTALVIALLCFGAYHWREPLMTIWPPSQRLYALLGLR